MSLFIGGAPDNLRDVVYPGIDHDHITIGVELELAIFDLKGDNRDNIVLFTLISDGLKEIEGKLSTPSNALKFTVKDDASIELWWQGGLNEPGVAAEVVTPILLGDQFEWVIPEVCAAINKLVQRLGARIDLRPESECGLHVHIGIQGRHYTFGELKRIAKAIVIFERAMDWHHAPHRRNFTQGLQNYIQSNRAAGLLKGLSTMEMVEKLEATTSSDQLFTTINHASDNQDKFFKYNLTATRKFGTVEFRQAEGTIDDITITQWIRNIITFVISATSASDDQFPVLAFIADEGFAWTRSISRLWGLPPPESQGLPRAPGRDEESDEEPEEESEDMLSDIVELSLDSDDNPGPARRRDTIKVLGARVSTKMHSLHLRERMSNKVHRNHIRERLSNRIKRALAKVSKRMALPPS